MSSEKSTPPWTTLSASYRRRRRPPSPRLDGTLLIPWTSPGRTAGEVRNAYAFAALTVDGRVVTWGNPYHGGDSSAAAERLVGVEQIFSTPFAFAALKADGTVVTWGYSSYGGDSVAVAVQLNEVEQIFSTDAQREVSTPRARHRPLTPRLRDT